METLETRRGNTRTLRVIPCKRWCFTLNNYTPKEMETLETLFRTYGEDDYLITYGFGQEVGENGTRHLQGWIDCKRKIRPKETFKNPRIHWEKTKGTRKQNIQYCSKEGNYHTNILSMEKKNWSWGSLRVNCTIGRNGFSY